jgi:hypothetical protein
MRILKTLVLVGSLVGLGAVEARAAAPPRPFGLGLILGAPTGLSAKLYLGKPFALQFGLGFVEDGFNDRGDSDGLHIHVEAVWHPAILANTPSFTLPFYIGVGGRILDDDDDYRCGPGGDFVCEDDDTYIGVRAPVGLLMDFKTVPLDVFLELAIVIDLIELDDDSDDPDFDEGHDRTHLHGAIGVRYYF